MAGYTDAGGALQALVLGAAARDHVRGRPHPVPGGVVFHAGVALARLGAKVRVVTRLRQADAAWILSPLVAEGVETCALESRQTTTYALDYGGPLDAHELRETSDPLGLDEVPVAWRQADVIQLGPLHRRDLQPGIARGLSGLIGLDIQGLVREAHPGGTRVAPNPELPAFLENVDIVQASEPELEAVLEGGSAEDFARRHAIDELIVTRGERGVTVIESGRSTSVAGVRARGSERIGAGDVFFAAYLLLRGQGREPVRAAAGACRVAVSKIDHGLVPKGTRLEDLCGV